MFPCQTKLRNKTKILHKFHNPGAPGSQGGAVVRALAPYPCDPALALRGFSPCIPVLPFPKTPTLLNSNSTRNTRTRLSELLELLSVSCRKTNCKARISVIRLILVISLCHLLNFRPILSNLYHHIIYGSKISAIS